MILDSVEKGFIVTGKAETENPGSYVRKLSKHWAHKLEVRYDEEHGEIKFPNGYCELDARQPGLLLISVSATERETVETLKQVVAVHLARFAVREALVIEWQETSAVSQAEN